MNVLLMKLCSNKQLHKEKLKVKILVQFKNEAITQSQNE